MDDPVTLADLLGYFLWGGIAVFVGGAILAALGSIKWS